MAFDIKLGLELHAKWLRGESGGEKLVAVDEDLSGSDLSGSNLSGSDLRRSNLSDSDLSGSTLRRSNLSDSDLSGSDLDFSSWPFRCGSFGAKADIRLVAQLAKHLAMLDVSLCCKGIQEAMDYFRRTGLAHLFDEFRDDVAETPGVDS